MMESIIRPFTDKGVSPRPFTKPGAQQNQMVRVAIGYGGTIKTIGTSFSGTLTSVMGQKHRERSPKSSASLTKAMSDAAGG